MPNFYTKDRNNKLTKFYPIDTSSGISEDRVEYNNSSCIPDTLYGKYVYFFAGFQPVWMYNSFSKDQLVIKDT